MDHIRTFVALPVEPTLRSAMRRWTCAFATSLPTVRWMSPDSFHLTLVFMGAVKSIDLPAVASAITNCARDFSPFSLSIGGLGGFPNLQQPQVLWVGCGAGKEPLGNLRSAVVRALFPFGYRDEQRTFSPHITIGRVKGALFREELEQLTRKDGADFGAMEVNEIHLMSSVKTASDYQYSVIARCPIGLRR